MTWSMYEILGRGILPHFESSDNSYSSGGFRNSDNLHNSDDFYKSSSFQNLDDSDQQL